MLKGQDDGSWSVSLRSRGGTDLARVAMALGGGGHTLAAGYSSYLDREKTIEALGSVVGQRSWRPDQIRARCQLRSRVASLGPLARGPGARRPRGRAAVPAGRHRGRRATSARVALGGLAVGGGLLAWAAALLNFLAYGTTARAARRAGAGDRAGAVAEGVQATWLALALGLAVARALPAPRRAADPAARRRRRPGRRGGGAVAADRRPRCCRCCWSRWPATAGCAACRSCAVRCGTCWPAAWSASCSARCWCTRSGWAWPARRSPTSPGRRVAAGAVRAGAGPRGRTRGARGPAPSRAQLVIGRDLLLRAAVLQLSFLVAAGVAARAGTAALGAHQIALQLFFFLALVLDAYAIAAQTLVGTAWAPAGRRRPGPPPAGWSLWGLGTGLVVAVLLLALRDRAAPAVHRRPRRPGAGRGRLVVPRRHAAPGRGRLRPRRRADGRRRRRLPAHGHHRRRRCSASCPLSLLAGPLGWGLAGVWTGLTLFIGLRLVGVLAAGGG